MPVLVTLVLGSGTRSVEADRIEKDPLLDANLLLFGTKALGMETPDGAPFAARVWSVPRAIVQSYVVGNRVTLPAAPAPEPPAPTAGTAEVPDGVRLATEMPPAVAAAGDALKKDRARRKKKASPVPATEQPVEFT